MSELRWVFSRAQGEALQFRLRLGADEESEQHGFRPFLQEQDHEDLRWYLESYMDLPDAGSQVRACHHRSPGPPLNTGITGTLGPLW